MNKCYLGIDLGTSAIKVLAVDRSGIRQRIKCAYKQTGTAGWLDALKCALGELDAAVLQQLEGICFSSQVGTYIPDTGEVIPWDSAAGAEELEQIKAQVSREVQIRELAMLHPDLISYPLPRLLYIKKHHPGCRAVIMPKELLIRELTGQTVTDVFSWRGLCHPERKAYAENILKQLDIQMGLPRLAMPADPAGTVAPEAAEKYGLPQGVRVYVGCNDFFAGLLGMGVWDTDSAFELSGTSAHLGMITRERTDGRFVSGPYFNDFATYGGTKSSGTSCDFAIRQLGIDTVDARQVYRQPPIFLPYLKGERAPIYDENARGVFFGISEQTTKQDMAYAALEGVVFSLYHIGQALGMPRGGRLITGGGSAVNKMMAQLKAALFERDILQVRENDASALGAAMLCMVGCGELDSLQTAAQTLVSYEAPVKPDAALGAVLRRRYEIYKELYADLKDTFEKFSQLKEGQL